MTRLRCLPLLLLAATVLAPPLRALQLECDVTVDLQTIPSANRNRLTNLERDIEDYINLRAS